MTTMTPIGLEGTIARALQEIRVALVASGMSEEEVQIANPVIVIAAMKLVEADPAEAQLTIDDIVTSIAAEIKAKRVADMAREIHVVLRTSGMSEDEVQVANPDIAVAATKLVETEMISGAIPIPAEIKTKRVADMARKIHAASSMATRVTDMTREIGTGVNEELLAEAKENFLAEAKAAEEVEYWREEDNHLAAEAKADTEVPEAEAATEAKVIAASETVAETEANAEPKEAIETTKPEADEPETVDAMKFKVALSFPGEVREYVSATAERLRDLLGVNSVFYDSWYTAELARPNLDLTLQKIYGHNAQLVVVFLRKEYEEKEWCGLELRAIRELIKAKKDERIMLMRFDNSDVGGFFSIDGYVDLRERPPKEAADLIVKRLRSTQLE